MEPAALFNRSMHEPRTERPMIRPALIRRLAVTIIDGEVFLK
jgi:hypothetical protein